MKNKVISKININNEKLSKLSKSNNIKTLLEIHSLIALCLFTIFAILYFNNIFFDGFFWEDFTEYVLPHQTYAANEFAKGFLPHWNNFSFAGMPFLADLQVGFFYPLNRLLGLFLVNNELPVFALELVIVLHFIIAQFNFWLLNKSFGISSLSSLLGAVTYSFSMLMICHVIHPMMIYHLAWFPLVLMYFRKGLIETELLKRIKYSIISGLIFGFSILSGHPQTMLYISLFLFFVYIFYLIYNLIKKGNAIEYLNISVFSFIPILIGICIFSIQLLPSLELAKESRRNENSFELATEGSLQTSQLISVFNPDIYGAISPNEQVKSSFYLNYKKDFKSHYYWETAFYFGLTSLILTLFYFISTYNKPKTIFFIFISIFALIYALGSNGFIFSIFYNLPYFGTFRNPTRIMFFMITVFSLSSSLGLDYLLSKDDNQVSSKKLKALIIAIFIPLLMIIILNLGLMDSLFDVPTDNIDITSFLSSSFSYSLILVLIIGVILFAIYKDLLNPIITIPLLILITFLDLYIFGYNFNNNKSNPKDTYLVDERIESAFKVNLAQNPNKIFRINSRMYNPSYMALPRNLGLMKSIMLIEGYNPLVLDKVHPPVATREEVNDLHNVQYEIGIDKVQNAPRFYENINNLGFAWINNNYIVLDSKDIAGFLKDNPQFDFKKCAIVEKKLNNKSNDKLNELNKSNYLTFNKDMNDTNLISSENNTNFKYNILKYNSEYIEFELESPNAGIVCLSEVYYPTIKLFVDDKESELLRTNYSLRGFEIGKGKHIIKMTYKSDKFTQGAYISISTILVSLLILLGIFAKSKSNKV